MDDLDEPPGFERIRLPRPQRLQMRRFSLFEHTTTPDLRFPDGVFCLAGANGLGKSTFLAALGYAVTGVVAEPGRDFLSSEDYLKKVRPYALTYFRGRISDEDAEAAEVELEMRVGDHVYSLTRGIFEPDELRALSVRNVATGDLLYDGVDDDNGARQEHYAQAVLSDCRLDSFAQLVFLQHFVMLFDERRDLLFWNERALSNALFLTFGLDPAMAREADRLQDDIRRFDSLTRNYNWQASDVRRQLEALTKAAGQADEDDDAEADEQEVVLDQQHRALSDEHEEAIRVAERTSEDLSNGQLGIARRSTELRAMRARYDRLWARRLHGHGHPSSHPVVTTTLHDARCSLCGTEGPEVVASVREHLEQHECPLCSSGLSMIQEESDGPMAIMGQLEALDGEIQAALSAMSAAEAEIDRLAARSKKSRETVRSLAADLRRFEEDNELALLHRSRTPDGLRAVAAVYEAQIEERMGRKEVAKSRRDRAKARLRPLQLQLTSRYGDAEERFLPRFEQLASQFLGLDLEVEPVRRPDRMLLRLSVAGERRTSEETLSESQRFFVDIALRMALLGQIAEGQDILPALLVDTPEGSLDIAYEAKAGSMFSSFVEQGFGLIMTANINTSKLLQRMAERCGTERMTLERMTDWTSLSEVQAEEENLFTEAYAELLTALASGG